MPAARNTPGLDKARQFLLDLAQDARSAGHALPSLRQCARMADVSLVTIWKAASGLKAEGRLFGKPGRRLRVSLPDGDTGQSPTLTGTLSPKWRATASLIERDILNGLYRPGERLPLLKELAARYNVSTKTIIKALHQLTREELLLPATGGHLVRPLTVQTGTHRSRIVLMGYGSTVGTGFADDQAHQEFLRQMEARCAQTGVSMEMILFKRSEAGRVQFVDGATGRPVRLADSEDVLGYLLLVVGNESLCDEVFNFANGFRKPFAVLDDIAGWDLPAGLRGNPLVRIFRNASGPRAGEQAARFLLGLGHRRVAYFSPFHSYGWSVARYDGLRRSYAAAGYPEGVVLCANSTLSYQDLYASVQPRADTASLQEAVRSWLSSRPNAYALEFEDFLKYLPTRCVSAEIHLLLRPFFDRALADPSITAWVVSGDTAALMAMDHLHGKRIAVPKRLSVFSFDNRLVSLLGYITTFDFNMHATVDAMLDFVLHHRLQKRNPSQVTEIEGFIVERRSTGPAPRTPGTGPRA